MPFLVRIVLYASSCRGIRGPTNANNTSRTGSDANHGIQEMGDDDTIDYSGYTRSNFIGFDVYLPVEEAQSNSKGQARERVPSTNGSLDARE